MTAATKDIRTTFKIDTDDIGAARLLDYPVEANTSIFGGTFVCLDLLGNAVPAQAQVPGSATLAKLIVMGRAERQVINQTVGGTISPDGIATGAAGSIRVNVRRGWFYGNINPDSTITQANVGQNAYLSDDNTFSLSDGGGTRPYAGWIADAGGTGMNTNATQVGVAIGEANPYAVNPYAALASQFKARNVVTSLAAYGGTGTNVLTLTAANGAFGAQDGITNAVGDVVLIQAGTTNLVSAADSGPWVVTAIGSGALKWVLTRPDWFTTGSVVAPGQVIDIGGEGTLWKGTQWKSFAAVVAAIVGTNDPSFYVGRVTQQVTFVASAFALANVGLLSAAKTSVDCTYTGTGAIALTVGYGPSGALTPGYIGTATCPLIALASQLTKNGATDVGVVNVLVCNW